jgi:hypothetical protein
MPIPQASGCATTRGIPAGRSMVTQQVLTIPFDCVVVENRDVDYCFTQPSCCNQPPAEV